MLRPLPGQGYDLGMTIDGAILALLAIAVMGRWSARRGQRHLAALPPEEVRFMRQGGSVAFWFCQGGALFLVLYGVKMFGVLGYRLAILIWLFAAVFCVCGILVRYTTRRSQATRWI
jgi:hypothetical protein